MAASYTGAHHSTSTSEERYKKRVIPIWYSNNGRIIFSGATGLRTTQVLEGVREISNATIELQNEQTVQNVGMCKTTT